MYNVTTVGACMCIMIVKYSCTHGIDIYIYVRMYVYDFDQAHTHARTHARGTSSRLLANLPAGNRRVSILSQPFPCRFPVCISRMHRSTARAHAPMEACARVWVRLVHVAVAVKWSNCCSLARRRSRRCLLRGRCCS